MATRETDTLKAAMRAVLEQPERREALERFQQYFKRNVVKAAPPAGKRDGARANGSRDRED